MSSVDHSSSEKSYLISVSNLTLCLTFKNFKRPQNPLQIFYFHVSVILSRTREVKKIDQNCSRKQLVLRVVIVFLEKPEYVDKASHMAVICVGRFSGIKRKFLPLQSVTY